MKKNIPELADIIDATEIAAYMLKPNGDYEKIAAPNPLVKNKDLRGKFSIDHMKSLLDCRAIEIMPCVYRGFLLVGSDTAAIDGSEYNCQATGFFLLKMSHGVYGNVMLIHRSMIKNGSQYFAQWRHLMVIND